MSRNWFVAIGVLALLVALFFGLRQNKIAEPEVSRAKTTESAAHVERPAPPAAGRTHAPLRPAIEPEIIERLRLKYGAKIANRYVQVKLIEALMRQYQKQDPEHWREKLLEVVRAAFPDRYDEIAKNLERRIEYERWMKENHAYLDSLEPDARRAAIREEREKLFGKEATDEIWASEYRNQAVADTLKEIEGLQDQNVRDKLATYTERLEEIYEEKYDTYLDQHRHEVMNRFLSLESVQTDLTNMPVDERKASLRDIRKGLGLDDAALERWDALDQERDARWEKGAKYMAERAASSKAYSGKELEDKLADLRRRMFGDEAEVIAAEEAGGLFRFQRPRKWGQN